MPSRRFAAAVVAAALAGTLVAVLVHRGPARAHASQARAVAAARLGQLPVAFERNVGQAPGSARFVARQPGYDLLIGATGATMILGGPRAKGKSSQLTLRTLGASPKARVSASARLPGRVSYFRGSDRRGWHTGIATFGQVRVSQVYPGVDLTYHGTASRLEYDFALAPGVAPGTVRLGVAGSKGLALDAHGDLVARTRAGNVVQQAPVAYQLVSGRRHDVTARFVLRHGEVSFAASGYDRSRPLVIDPVMSYSTYLGGVGSSQAYGVSLDASGDIFVSGYTSSSGFVAASNGSSGGDFDAFVIELDPSGSSALYSAYLGGDGDDEATAIALDSAGDAYVAGFTNSSDFPMQGADPYGITRFAAFVAEIDPAGDSLVYTRLLTGTQGYAAPSGGDTEAEAIAVDASGAAYVTGITTMVDLPWTPGAFQPGNPDPHHGWTAFVAKIKPASAGGPDLAYLTGLGGRDTGEGLGIAVAGGHAFVTGITHAGDFPTTADAYQPTYAHSGYAAFVSELTADGSGLVYSTYLADPFGITNGTAIQIMADGKIVVAGTTAGGLFPVTAGAFQPAEAGDSDAFVTVLDPSAADQLVYSTYLGGSVANYGESVDVDSAGDIYITGRTTSDDFPTVDAFASANGPPDTSDAFVAKFDPSQSGAASLVYSSYLGGGGSGDWGAGIAVRPGGGAVVVGLTTSATFPTVNPLQTLPSGMAGAGFATKIDEVPGEPTGVSAVAGAASAAVSFTPPSIDGGEAITTYTVTASPGGAQASGSTSPLTVTGLTPGSPYTFTVAATNGVGSGPDSAPSAGVAPYAADGSGSASVSPGEVVASSVHNTVVLTYHVAAGGISGGALTVEVPPGWSAPSRAGKSAGFTVASAGTVSVAGQTITVSGLTSAAGGTVAISYGDRSGGGPGATDTATGGAQPWVVSEKSVSGGDATALASSPSVAVLARDGSGTIGAAPRVVRHSTAGAVTFTYTAAAGGIDGGTLTLAVPSGWSPPSTTPAARGYVTATAGSVSVSGATITVKGLTLAGGSTVTVVYGSRTGGGAGALSPATRLLLQTWRAAEHSSGRGTLTALASSPSVLVA